MTTDGSDLLALEDPRLSLDLAVFHYLTTPPPRTEAEYLHMQSEAARLVTSLRGDDPPEAVAMAWAVVDRVVDYACERHEGA